MKTRHKWDAGSIPDQRDRIAIVTGSSSGIGFETARVLAEKNATVILAVRNKQKGESALEKIKTEHPDTDVSVMLLDLASLKSIKTFTDEFKENYKQLDLLINNAGVMMPPYSKTKDGFEVQMGTNHFGHFALTGHLFDLLKRTPDSRVVTVSSVAHNYGKIDFSDLAWESRRYKTRNAYADSKIANLYFTYALSQKVEKDSRNPLVTAAHPGWTATDLQRHSGLLRFLNLFFSQNISMGALPTLYAAVGPDVKNGDYYGPSGFLEMRGYPKKVKSNPLSRDEPIAKKLWDISEGLTGIKYSF